MGHVGEQVRSLREEKGWTQPRLSVETGLAVSGISQIENGRRNPNAATLARLAKALNVEVADLFPKAEAPLPFEEGGPEQRRSPFLEAWTSYMLRRAQQLEDALPEKARALRPTLTGSVSAEQLQELTEELRTKPELASKIMLQYEMMWSEFDATSLAILEAHELARRIDAPELVFEPGTRRYARADFREFERAWGDMFTIVDKWTAAEKAARAAGDTADNPEVLARAEEASRARRKVVALFEGRASA
ncbi:MAG: hypothetical protein CYG60_00125 [Actinobacteria bacterium]|nr:MAG: hypothetical protein CYG60_00125 [Actinomycetota bacterium]